MGKRRHIRTVMDDAENQRLRELLQLLVEKEKNQRDAAKRLGISQPRLSTLLRGHTFGYTTARQVARAFGMTLEEALGQVFEESPDRYPNRGKVVAAARYLGMTERSIDRLQAIRLPSGAPDPPTAQWMRHLINLEEVTTPFGVSEPSAPAAPRPAARKRTDK